VSTLTNAIGGYFELELPNEKLEKYPKAFKSQSARSSFYALLLALKDVQRVHAPAYICDSMLAPIAATGKKIVFYEIDHSLFIKEKIFLQNNDLLLYVNYFGVCGNNVNKILGQYNRDQVVIDCSQAFYAGPYKCLATIYSPRKFFGVPDGGLLITDKVLDIPDEQDQESIFRMDHLLQRHAFSAEEGYLKFLAAEKSLTILEPKRISNLTLRLLKSINYSAAEKKRKSNFIFLNKHLKKSNSIKLDDIKVAPMCYPYLSTYSVDRVFFSNSRIYFPAYWHDVHKRSAPSSFSMTLANNLLAIPCDQRYSETELQLIVNYLVKQEKP